MFLERFSSLTGVCSCSDYAIIIPEECEGAADELPWVFSARGRADNVRYVSCWHLIKTGERIDVSASQSSACLLLFVAGRYYHTPRKNMCKQRAAVPVRRHARVCLVRAASCSSSPTAHAVPLSWCLLKKFFTPFISIFFYLTVCTTSLEKRRTKQNKTKQKT